MLVTYTTFAPRNERITMKIIHTADWHLGNTFHGHSREEEHHHFLEWLLAQIIIQKPDALVVAGDIYDTANPSARAEEMLYAFLLRVTNALPGLQVVLIAGNHDSGGRLEAPSDLLKLHNIYVRGVVRFTEKGEPDFSNLLLPLSPRDTKEAACVCLALPYLRSNDCPPGYTIEKGISYYLEELIKCYRKSDYRGLPLLLAAHFYAAGAEICESEHSERLVVGGSEAVNSSILPSDLSYIALGHIHKGQRVKSASQAFYAGSPLPMSFAEVGYRRGVMLVEIDGEGNTVTTRLDYSPRRALMTIPDRKGEAFSPESALESVARLPKRKKNDENMDYPYLEIRVRESQPEPDLLYRLTEALADRAVLLCRCLRSGSDGTTKGESTEKETRETFTPLDLARICFRKEYKNAEMPQPLVDRFKIAEEEAHKI